MNKGIRKLTILPMVIGALTLGATAGWTDDHDENEIPFAEGSKVFFQLNDTDGDLGIHAKFDGELWKWAKIEGPNERTMFRVGLHGKLRRQGLTELAFESAEPSFDELDPEVFFARFPPGEYEIEGMTLEGEDMETTSVLTHVLPAAPGGFFISGAAAPEDCDEDPVPSVSDPVIISWGPVTESHDELGESGPVEITRYEVAVEREEPTTLTLTFDVPPDVNAIQVPPGLLGAGEEIKFQILATDAGGNETSAESCFETE